MHQNLIPHAPRLSHTCTKARSRAHQGSVTYAPRFIPELSMPKHWSLMSRVSHRDFINLVQETLPHDSKALDPLVVDRQKLQRIASAIQSLCQVPFLLCECDAFDVLAARLPPKFLAPGYHLEQASPLIQIGPWRLTIIARGQRLVLRTMNFKQTAVHAFIVNIGVHLRCNTRYSAKLKPIIGMLLCAPPVDHQCLSYEVTVVVSYCC
jgi:hypothetical protein